MKFQTILNIVLILGIIYLGFEHYQLKKSLSLGITFTGENGSTKITSDGVEIKNIDSVNHFSSQTVLSTGFIELSGKDYISSISSSGYSLSDFKDSSALLLNSRHLHLNNYNKDLDKNISKKALNISLYDRGLIYYKKDCFDTNDNPLDKGSYYSTINLYDSIKTF